MIPAAILAAGRSGRMGASKAFLDWNGRAFIETIAASLRQAGAPRILAILRPGEIERARALSGAASAIDVFLANADPNDEGPISSIRVALGFLCAESSQNTGGSNTIAVHGLAVCLVDHPAVQSATYSTLFRTAAESPGRIIIPSFGGKRGHPVIFPAEVFADLRAVPPGRGADWAVEQNASRLLEISVEDPGILRDIDTPEEYGKALASMASLSSPPGCTIH